jgi:hypothetical protein
VPRRPSPAREERLNTPFLRSIGALSIASFELRMLTPSAAETVEPGLKAWTEFADHLLATAHAVMEGACGSTFPGNTISIRRDGVQVAVDPEYLDKLTEKMHRHVKIGHALGAGERAGAGEELSLTA